MNVRARTWVGLGSLLAGLAIAAVLVLTVWTIQPGSGTIGASISFSAVPTGELDVTPSGAFLTGEGMEPPEDTEGSFEVRNQTGVPLAVSLRGVSSEGTLGDVLSVEVLADDEVVFSGPLGGFGEWTDPIRLSSGQTATVEVRVTLPEGADGFEGRLDRVTVEFAAEAEES
jgi:hypothetical protein